MAVFYELRIKGHLNGRWAHRVQGMRASLLPSGETVLSGSLADQAALHAVLNQIRDLGLELLSVIQLQPGRPIGIPAKEEQTDDR